MDLEYSLTNLDGDQQAALKAVVKLAQTCDYEASHSHQVTRLGLLLFDDLEPLHKLGLEQRYWLECAGILHDIGWIEGWHNHHKTSQRIILTTPLLPFNNRERLIIGSIARYHSKAMPSLSHDHFATLGPEDRQVVCVLAACLRLADGLDHSHHNQVKDLRCKIKPKKIIVVCDVVSRSDEETLAAQRRSDLMANVFQRPVVIDWAMVEGD
jgi:exopolyphosphatase/guanosine-5'-triphosphate,3'-diphosphate pyrophosphatase